MGTRLLIQPVKLTSYEEPTKHVSVKYCLELPQ